MHGQQGKWHHICIAKEDVLLELEAIEESVGACEVEGLVLINELTESAKLRLQVLVLVEGVDIGLERLPRSILAVYSFAELDCVVRSLELVIQRELRLSYCVVPRNICEAWIAFVLGAIRSGNRPGLAGDACFHLRKVVVFDDMKTAQAVCGI